MWEFLLLKTATAAQCSCSPSSQWVIVSSGCWGKGHETPRLLCTPLNPPSYLSDWPAVCISPTSQISQLLCDAASIVSTWHTRPKEMEKFAQDYTMIQKEPKVERPLPGFLRFTSLASIIPFTRDSGRNGAAAHSRADETSHCKQDRLLGLLNCLGIVPRAKHDHRPSPLPAQLCQETWSSTTLDSQINPLSQNRCHQFGPKPSVAPIACRKKALEPGEIWQEVPWKVPRQVFRTSRAKILSKKTHFRREEIVVHQGEPQLRAKEPVFVPALQLWAYSSCSGTQFSLNEGCDEGSKSLVNCKGLSGWVGITVDWDNPGMSSVAIIRHRREPKGDHPGGQGLRTGTREGRGQNQDHFPPPCFQTQGSQIQGLNVPYLLYLSLLSFFHPLIFLLPSFLLSTVWLQPSTIPFHAWNRLCFLSLISGCLHLLCPLSGPCSPYLLAFWISTEIPLPLGWLGGSPPVLGSISSQCLWLSISPQAMSS